MMSTLIRRSLASFAALGVSAGLLASSPALANSSANASASADVVQPVRDAQADSLTSGDERFRQLFANWTALDTAGPEIPGTPPPTFEQPVVSIPSLRPIQGGRMSSGFGRRRHPVLGGFRQHAGVDLAAPTGTPVYATADGIVGRADRFGAYGLFIAIDHGAELETRYAHLSRLAVSAGDRVRQGDVIGYVGSTGRSTGPHLHYEVRIDGVAVDPIPYMVGDHSPVRAAEREPQIESSRSTMLQGRRRIGGSEE